MFWMSSNFYQTETMIHFKHINQNWIVFIIILSYFVAFKLYSALLNSTTYTDYKLQIWITSVIFYLLYTVKTYLLCCMYLYCATYTDYKLHIWITIVTFNLLYTDDLAWVADSCYKKPAKHSTRQNSPPQHANLIIQIFLFNIECVCCFYYL